MYVSVFDRLPEVTAFLVNKFAIFEFIFDSGSLKKPITQLLGIVMLGYSQNFGPYTFLR